MTTAKNSNALARGSNAFAFELWSRAAKSAKGNFAMSPASISMALAMTYGGAKGETAAQRALEDLHAATLAQLREE